MRLLIISHLQNARQSMRSNQLRSALTMIGVTIGVASITTILALSEGAKSVISSQIDELGGNIAVIRPGSPETSSIDGLTGIASDQRYAVSTLTSADMSAVEKIGNIAAVAPLMVLQGSVTGTAAGPTNTAIVATTPSFNEINELALRDGQFLDASLNPNTAVIGPQLAVDIFGTESAIGKTVTVKGKDFTIVGVLKRTNNPINYNNVDFDKAVIVNFESGRELNQGAVHLQQINIEADSVQYLGSVITEVNKTLLKTHLGEADFAVLSGDDIARPTSAIFAAIAGTTIAIAAISLIVGGVGIMNIMLVSVAERTREIGIRKALGASNGDIVAQFLVESLALSIGGGIIGYISGYLLAFVISTFLTFDPVLSWSIAGTAIGVSVVIGTIFGIYPALRAARKDPISALRHYE